MNTPPLINLRLLLAITLTSLASPAWALSIMSYGAAGNGSTNDTTAVNNAFAAAAASGDWLTGENKTYAVSGDITVPAGLKLKDAKFKQLSPATGDRITLSGSSANNINLQNVTVNRNGSGSNGDVNNAAGMKFNACNDLVLDKCEVYGNDKGNGIILQNCQRFLIDRPYVHDIRYVNSGGSGLQVTGIFLISSSMGSVRQPNISNLGRTATGADHDRDSRGLALGGCNTVSIDNPTIALCDTGIFAAGSAGNTNIAITGGAISNVYSSGITFGDSAIGCTVTGVTIEHAGINGILIDGPNSEHVNMPRDFLITGCIARNIGSQKQGSASSVRAFAVTRQGSGVMGTFPKNVQFTGCMAIADEGSTTFSVFASGEFSVVSNNSVSLSRGSRVTLSSTGSLPTGLSAGTDYWLIPIPDTTRFKLASSYANALAGTAVSTSSSGTGTQTMTLQSFMYDAFFSDVIVDSNAPVFTRNCRASGFTNKAFNGVQFPLASVNHGSTIPVAKLTWVDVKPNNDIHDSLGMIDATTPTPDFIVPFAGVWRLEANVEFAPSNTGYRAMRFMVDTGSGYASTNTGVKVSGQSAAVECGLNGAWEGPLKRGDKVKVQVYQTTSSTLNLTIPRIVFRLVLDTGV